MDILGAFKTEIFRPLVTLAIPGVTSVAPLVPVVTHYNPKIRGFWEAHPASFVALFVIAILATGLILEDIGARIEDGIWDEMIERKSGKQHADWRAYLRTAWEREPIGHRYLRTVLVRLKFELSFGLSIIAAVLGLLWLQVLEGPWARTQFGIFAACALVCSAYLLWESYGSAWVLARTRHLLLHNEPLATFPAHHSRAYRRLADVARWQSLAWGLAALFALTLPAVAARALRVEPSDSTLVLTRIIGAVGLGLALSGWYVATDGNLSRPRAVAGIAALVHILVFVFLALPRVDVGWSVLAVAHLALQLSFAVAFARVALLSAEEDGDRLRTDSIASA